MTVCDECFKNPCDNRCPNAKPKESALECSDCGSPIEPGDEYARIDGALFCESCLEDMPLCILIPMAGGEWNTASEADCYGD